MKVLALDHGETFTSRMLKWRSFSALQAREVIIEELAQFVDATLLPGTADFAKLRAALQRSAIAQPIFGMPDLDMRTARSFLSGDVSLAHQCRIVKIEVQLDAQVPPDTVNSVLGQLLVAVGDRKVIVEPILMDDSYDNKVWSTTLKTLSESTQFIAKIRPFVGCIPGHLDQMRLEPLRAAGWLIASSGRSFDEYRDLAANARGLGCVGYAAGTAIWGDLLSKSSGRDELRNLMIYSARRLAVLNDLF